MTQLSDFLKYRERSPIIAAIDIEPSIGINEFLEEAKRYIAGIKVGLPYLLSKGVSEISEIINRYREDYFFIADIKLADIGFVGRLMIDLVKEMGFNAFISHGFIGLEGALEEIKRYADELGLFLFVVAAMSHPGAEEIFNKNFNSIMEASNKIGVLGFVAPATLPNYIRRVKEKVPGSIIISPGVGAQGASIGDAILAGATFEIIGRKITLSDDPLSTLDEIILVYRNKRVI